MSKMQSSMVELGTVAPAFELVDVVSGKAMGRDDIAAQAHGRGLLVMFICVHCPYVKHVEAGLAEIGRDYAGKIASAARPSSEAAPAAVPQAAAPQAAVLQVAVPQISSAKAIAQAAQAFSERRRSNGLAA